MASKAAAQAKVEAQAAAEAAAAHAAEVHAAFVDWGQANEAEAEAETPDDILECDGHWNVLVPSTAVGFSVASEVNALMTYYCFTRLHIPEIERDHECRCRLKHSQHTQCLSYLLPLYKHGPVPIS